MSIKKDKQIALLVIAGPTASGKTSMAIKLAKELNAELVGADSMQVYKHMNIGTDTPTKSELDGVTHHMLNIVNPNEQYDTAKFCRDADKIITNINAKKKRIIVVGGTGLYIKVLLRGLQNGPPPNKQIRSEILTKAQQNGWPSLHIELQKLDQKTAKRLHPNDGVRILRALEVVIQSGIPISKWQEQHAFKDDKYSSLTLGLIRDKELLNTRINQRIFEMLKNGFVDEVKSLLDAGYHSSLKPMQGLGYKRICEYLLDHISYDEAIEKTQIDTRRFAKRQRTWFKGQSELAWTNTDIKEFTKVATEFFDTQDNQ